MPSWFDTVLDLATKAMRTRGQDYFLGQLTAESGASPSETLRKDHDYVTIRIRSFRIVNVREGTGRFYGSVQSRAHYLHTGKGPVEHEKVLVPEFKEMDAAHVDRVLVVDKPVLGPVPYIGALSLELGLFSVKATDLAAPYLQLLTGLAETAGMVTMGAAHPYVEILRKGTGLLFGNDKQSSLEIGMDKTWPDSLSTGTWLLMRAPRNEIDLSQLRLNPSDGKITGVNGASIERFPYLVFGIERSQERDDWMTLPELKSAMADIEQAVKDGRSDDAEKLFERFIVVARWCPDLVPADAQRLARKIKEKLLPIIQSIESRTTISKRKEVRSFPSLEWLDLYDRETN